MCAQFPVSDKSGMFLNNFMGQNYFKNIRRTEMRNC